MQYYPIVYSPNSYTYFFGRLTREESEPILRRRGCLDGSFLLREKLEEPGSYVLSMCYQNQIKHYKFDRKKNKNLQLGNSRQFIGPIELINYLQRNDVGLVTRPAIECKRFANTDPVYYLFVETSSFLDAVEKQIKLRCRGEEIVDARGRLRYIYESFALKDLHLTQRWYRKNTNKDIAEELFKENGYGDGKFLLRSNRLNKYKLTVCFQNTLNHYKIMLTDGRYSIEGSVGEEFEYLAHLIDYYGRKEGFLKCLLTMPYDVNFSLKQTYFCDTNNNYRAFINDNENIVQAGRVIEGEIFFTELILIMPTVKFLGKICEGNFSKLYKALYKPKNSTKEVIVAVKVLKDRSDHLLYDEAEMLNGFNHENIIRVLEPPEMLDENLRNSVIILEHAEIGPINKYLKENDSSVKLPELLVLIEQIASAMVYIAFHKHVHGDIAARNVLLFSKDLAKISDFSHARKLDDSEYYRIKANAVLPIKWYAPEVLKYKKFTQKSDIWSFGVFLWECLTYGDPPFAMKRFTDKSDLEEFIKDISSGKLTLSKPERCPDDLFELMQRCWCLDQTQRPTFQEIHDEIVLLIDQHKSYDTRL